MFRSVAQACQSTCDLRLWGGAQGVDMVILASASNGHRSTLVY